MRKLSLKEWLAVVITLVVVVAIFVVGPQMFNLQSGSPDTASQAVVGAITNNNQDAVLEIIDEVVGTGAEAVSGKVLTVQYTGTLTNGSKFDSSYDHGSAFSFTLGAGQVISGWDNGLVGMKVGGKRKLTIPANLAYGPQALTAPDGTVLIPANSTLVFEVELLEAK